MRALAVRSELLLQLSILYKELPAPCPIAVVLPWVDSRTTFFGQEAGSSFPRLTTLSLLHLSAFLHLSVES